MRALASTTADRHTPAALPDRPPAASDPRPVPTETSAVSVSVSAPGHSAPSFDAVYRSTTDAPDARRRRKETARTKHYPESSIKH